MKRIVDSYEPSICPERATLLTESFQKTEGMPMILRRAKGLESVLERMSIYILADELIVGNQAREPRSAPIFPEFDIDWIDRELGGLPTRPLDPFRVDEITAQAIRKVIPFWRGKTHHDRARGLMQGILPRNILEAYDFGSKNLNQVLSNASHMTTGDGHIVPGYSKVLNDGLGGMIRQVRGEVKTLNLRDGEDQKKKIFLEAVLIVCYAGIRFAHRFARKARIMAEQESNPSRREELLAIAENCLQVPGHPPRNFWQALQSLWLIHVMIQIESNGHSISLGRFDQYLFPFYRSDIERGLLNPQKALELIESFWVKCGEPNKVREWAFTQFMSGYCMFQTLTLGGLTPDGQDAVNDLSYLCLEATGRMKTTQPTTVVRCSSKTPEAFLVATCQALLEHGGGLPAFFNDEVAIPLLTSLGVKLEEARDWSVMGCSEVQVGGKFLPATGGTCHVNLLKILEITLNGGVNPSTKRCLLAQSGDLATFKTYAELYEALERQVKFYYGLVPILDHITAQSYAELTPTPFLSCFVDGRMAYGRDVSEGGGPNYNNQIAFGYGLVNVANSLGALKKLVFEDQAISARKLMKALASNFEGVQGELIRQMLIHRGPKFGNNDPAVDGIAREVGHLFVSAIQAYKPWRGGIYGPTTQSLSGNVPHGMAVGATPDGRRSRQPLADNNSPTAGTDVNGPTAAILSVTRLDHERFANGTIFNLKFHPAIFDGGRERIQKFASLIRTFFGLKGFQVQFNIFSPETLRDAQEHPENYPNLVVKVAGYSALFSSLDKRLQDQIIERTTHVSS